MSIRKVGVAELLTAAAATVEGDQIEPWHTNRSFEVYGACDDEGEATVVIEVRNSENATWKTLATITITLGTETAGDGCVSNAAWRYVRANLTAISGTNAAVSANMGTAPL
jgi:hypothetical protein